MKPTNKLKQNNILSLLAFIVIVFLVIYISSFVFFRLDLTSEKRYTLSESTVDLLEQNTEGIYIKIYLEGEGLPPGFKKLQRSVRELLDEFDVYSGNNLNYEFINPSESLDKKARVEIYNQLRKKGIYPIELNDKDNEGKVSKKIIFPGAILVYNGKEVAINFLKNTQGQSAENNLNNSIQSLEYEFVNAFRKLVSKEKISLAFIKGHGELHELQVEHISQILREYYEVQSGVIGGLLGSMEQFKAIIIAKPRKKFSEEDKFVIDQYIMNGGRVLWLLDGTNASIDSLTSSKASSLAPSALVLGNDYNITDQLFKYGARVNPNILMDVNFAFIGLMTQQQRIQKYPWFYYPVIQSDNKHFITKYLNLIKTEFLSSVDTVGDSPDIKRTILLKTSKLTHEINVPFRLSFDILNRKLDQRIFDKSGMPVAILLEGSFESLYKNRNISHLSNYVTGYKLKSKNTKMIVVGDGDIIRNKVDSKNETYPLGLGFMPDGKEGFKYKGNSEFLLNAVNYLCGDEALMNLRMRELKLRLLDKPKIQTERAKWQLINVVSPIFIILLFAFALIFIRKRKYSVSITIPIKK